MQFSFRLVGLSQLQSKLTKALTQSPINDGIKKLVLFVERETKKETPVDIGRLRSGVTHQLGDYVGIVGTAVPYGAFVEYGTKPHFPPVAAVQGWANRHGAVAFLVARGISRHGTKAHHMFQKGMEKTNARIGEFLKGIGDAISVRWDS